MTQELIRYNGKLIYYAILCCIVLLAQSCRDNFTEHSPEDSDYIQFAVVDDIVVATRSESREDMVERQVSNHSLTTINGEQLFLECYEDDGIDSHNTPTRSASYTTETLTTFYLTAYLNDTQEFMKNQKVELKEGDWVYSPVKYWPNNKGDKISFFGYAAYNDKGNLTEMEFAGHGGSFKYALPMPDDTREDAFNQPDLIFAVTPDMEKPDVNRKVQLAFHHALSAIVFKVGTMPANVTIHSISLKNVSASGECTFGLSEDKTDIVFSWTASEQKDDYTQQFNKFFEGDEEEKLITGEDQLFMMIPQSLEGAILEVSFKIGEKIYSLDRELDDFTEIWEADKKYTYIINTNGVVEVEVEDKVTSNVKSDVKIQNTGLSTSYIRAAVVGYWENENGDIVAPWEFTDTQSGSIIKADDWGNYWEAGTDGFYYHKEPVTPGEYTEPLFDKYELMEQPPIVGARLIINIVVQARDAEWQ